MSNIADLKAAVQAFDEEAAIKAAEKVVASKEDAVEAVNAMGDALTVLGDQFTKMEVFLPEILLATDAFKAALKVLEPELAKNVSGAMKEKPKVVIATVKGDVHAVGKDMVATMLTVAGFDVKNLGADVDSEAIIRAAEDENARIIALSALMSTTIPYQKQVIEFLNAKGLRSKFRVIVGGGSTTQQWAEQIGSDGWSKDAIEAVDLAKRVLGMK